MVFYIRHYKKGCGVFRTLFCNQFLCFFHENLQRRANAGRSNSLMKENRQNLFAVKQKSKKEFFPAGSSTKNNPFVI